jgi:pimeloyl-ACP methyl ester carboxylesterase
VLGYQRFAAHGADIGSLVAAQLGHKYTDCVAGIHLCGALRLHSWHTKRPWADLMGPVLQRCAVEDRDDLIAWERERVSHIAVQSIEPQTLAYAMNDSPLGMAAWLVERRRSWSDCDGDVESVFTKDDLITSTMIYWLSQTFATAARYYLDAGRYPWAPTHDRSPIVETPTGISAFAGNLPPGYDGSWCRDYYNVIFQREHPKGGHFPPVEQPAALVEDLRDTFRLVRPSGAPG